MRNLKLLLILALLSGAQFAHAKADLDAVQFENVPLDSSWGCNRTLFKSTQHFDGTLYYLPRVLSRTPGAMRDLLQIETDPKVGLILSIGLYFPSAEEEVRSTWNEDQNNSSRCNFDAIKESLNRGIKHEGEQIKRMAPLPLTSVEVVVPGVGKPGRIGRSTGDNEEVDILDYNGKVMPFEISISSEEKNGVVRRLARSDGLPVEVRLRFQARSRNGGVRAKIDWHQLATSLKASLGGQLSIARVGFQAALQNSVSQLSAEIEVDGGGSASTDQVVEKIMAMLVPAASPQPPRSPGPSPTPPGQAPGAAPAQPAAAPAPAGSMIDVTAALERINAMSSQTIEYKENSKVEVATAATIVPFLGHLRDPNTEEVRVRAGFQNPIYDHPITAGETLKIVLAHQFLAKYRFAKQSDRYLTTSQIEELNLGQEFSDLSDPQMSVTNMTLRDKVMAVGYWYPVGGLSPVASPNSYFWRRTILRREVIPNFPKQFAAGLVSQALGQLPITIGFSALGGGESTTLSGLIGDHEAWVGTLDEGTGAIVLTAKRDLGIMTFISRFAAGEKSFIDGQEDLVIQDVNMDTVKEERHGALGRRKETHTAVLFHDPITIVQSRIVSFMINKVTKPNAYKSVSSEQQETSEQEMVESGTVVP